MISVKFVKIFSKQDYTTTVNTINVKYSSLWVVGTAPRNDVIITNFTSKFYIYIILGYMAIITLFVLILSISVSETANNLTKKTLVRTYVIFYSTEEI